MICVGAPRLHEHLKNNFKLLQIKSVLLDFDKRFYAFQHCNDNETPDFFHYNMFNNYFFGGDAAQQQFEQFLKESNAEQCCLFTDPPFGCRTEPLAFTIQMMSRRYREINQFQQILPVLWIFPYFMEPYVSTVMPEMDMVDYKIDYTNHETYHGGEKGRKQGSPVRIFTNVPLNLIELPARDGYKFCTKCKRWVAIENKHCPRCKKCPSKNGDSYVHCQLCGTCVKPTYKHCVNCWRCTQVKEHQCQVYQTNLKCAICLQRGHNELNCRKWFGICDKSENDVEKLRQKMIKTKRRICLVCFKSGHNESSCMQRKNLLNENTFLDSTSNILNL